MLLAGLLLALKLRARIARAAWLALLIAGLANALFLSLLPHNLININLVHHFLGAKYAFSYNSLYQLINAARETPQIGMRDLDRPPAMVRSDPRAQRAYYIDLMRADGVDFDPLSSLDDLARRAVETGCIQREARHILDAHLPPALVGDFERDARLALGALSGRDITTDYGFNGSPLYALVRRADPTLHRPFGPATARLNLAWQIAAALLVVWMAGMALGVNSHERLAMLALLFASWDFVGWSLPGLVFAGWWLPVAVALLALRRRAAAPAGIAVAWAGLIKIFPFVLALPHGVRLIGLVLRRHSSTGAPIRWSLLLLATCIAAAGALGMAAMLSGRSWTEFLSKIVAQFQSEAYLINSVSLSQGLLALGIHASPLPAILSLVAMGMLTLLFVRGSDPDFMAALPRRSLVLLAATGLWLHTWFNYYAIAPLLLLPLVARQHRVGAAAAAMATAGVFLLPEFDHPLLLDHRFLLGLKVAPYILIPIWLVGLELENMAFAKPARRAITAVVVLCCVATAAEAVRAHAIKRLDRTGGAHLDRGRAREAREVYRRMATLAPRNATAHMNRGIALAMLEDPAAGAAFGRASALDPHGQHARQNYGRWLLKVGRAEDAIAELEAARRLAPFDDGALVDLGRAQLARNRRNEARALFARALELNPRNQTAQRLLKETERE
jgi:Flp pilus assembly protein TadD